MTIAVATNTNGRGVPHARTIEGRVAAQLLGIELFSQPVPIRPIPEHVRNRIEGVYIDGNNRFEARVVDDALHVILNGNTVEQLRWTGDLNFRDTDNPAVREWFVMDGETAGWWIYEVDGLCMNVARRKCLQDDR